MDFAACKIFVSFVCIDDYFWMHFGDLFDLSLFLPFKLQEVTLYVVQPSVVSWQPFELVSREKGLGW